MSIMNWMLQFLFVRLVKREEKLVKNYTLMSFDMMSDGSISPCGAGEIDRYTWCSIMRWVVPFTGKSIGKPKYTRITSKRLNR